ncbi:MAG: HAD family hydrolase [Amphritea sp.]|nr:HAD family hydrolase [Amphritea sp.]
MIRILLFDWGDTLMVDFPEATGKMCDWEHVACVDGAEQTLATLSQNMQVYVATGAADSTRDDIIKAFKRVALDQYIQGYFCSDTLGVGKDSPDFFPRILQKLNCSPCQVAMIGDSLERDILPAVQAGIQGYYLNDSRVGSGDYKAITRLNDLLTISVG